VIVVERKRETLAGTENLGIENDKTEFLDAVWNRREAWGQGDFVSKVGISRAVLREERENSLRYEEDSLVCSGSQHKFGILIAIIRIHKTEFRPHFPF
jgi:hypothetical protein